MQNIGFALGVKFFSFVYRRLGQANRWEAVFTDVGVAVLAIGNASRALRVENY
jgi:Cd2+/Zn2+-exporting ATPase